MMKYLQFVQLFFIIIIIKKVLYRGWAFPMGVSRVTFRSLNASFFRLINICMNSHGFLPGIYQP